VSTPRSSSTANVVLIVGRYIDSEKDTDWYLWTGSIYVKPLRFESRSGMYVIALKTEPHAELGKHRHRGMVKAYTINGPWGYHE
jgi:2,4'-dihydroxyacetophenone dioxygenase